MCRDAPADVAALTDGGSQTKHDVDRARAVTTMAEGTCSMFAPTIEFLSQLKTLKSTHPPSQIRRSSDAAMRRGVLEELPDDARIGQLFFSHPALFCIACARRITALSVRPTQAFDLLLQASSARAALD